MEVSPHNVMFLLKANTFMSWGEYGRWCLTQEVEPLMTIEEICLEKILQITNHLGECDCPHRHSSSTYS